MKAVLPILLVLLAAEAQAQTAERVPVPVRVSGVVFLDRNGNGVRDAGDPGLPDVVVSDQVTVLATDREGRFALDAGGYGFVFVAQPDGYRSRGPFWARATPGAEIAFPLVAAPAPRSFTFIHASDTHISPASVDRTRRLRALVDSLRPAFVMISGDLVRDALRVSEAEARGYYEMFARELEAFPVPVYLVPGNHEIFGIERHHSLVSPSHPLYGKRMYRSFFGPDYYSFTYGGVHFIGVASVDYADLWYNGHVDSVQVAWIRSDVARLSPGTRVVTFNHIPFVSGTPSIDGYDEESVAPTVIRIGGRTYFRHTVRNTAEVLEALGDRLELALGGHFHRREMLRYETAFGERRFYQTAAVVGPPRGEGPMGLRSGITLYRATDGRVDDGTFIPLDPGR